MYDAIIVGARCAGSPTAMLLARGGFRVLLLDRASFPSDVISNHYIHQPGVARLERWGLLEKVRASGCPPIGGPVTLRTCCGRVSYRSGLPGTLPQYSNRLIRRA